MMPELYYGTLARDVADKVGHELEMLMAAFDCAVPDNAGVYCSTDITTGKKLYLELFAQHNVRSNEELAAKLGTHRCSSVKADLVQSNIRKGVDFANSVRMRGVANVITPAPFKARHFGQREYLYLWEWVIIKKAHAAYFNDGWEFSDGCTLEYAVAAKKRIPRFDHLGNLLDTSEAARKIENAIRDLADRKIAPLKLEVHLKYLT